MNTGITIALLNNHSFISILNDDLRSFNINIGKINISGFSGRITGLKL